MRASSRLNQQSVFFVIAWTPFPASRSSSSGSWRYLADHGFLNGAYLSQNCPNRPAQRAPKVDWPSPFEENAEEWSVPLRPNRPPIPGSVEGGGLIMLAMDFLRLRGLGCGQHSRASAYSLPPYIHRAYDGYPRCRLGGTSTLHWRSNSGFAADRHSIRVHFPLRAFSRASFLARAANCKEL